MHGNILIFIAFNAVWTTVGGISLGPASDLTLQNFTLVCNLEGNWTNPIQISYGSNLGGGCSSPPNPTCVSSVGTITTTGDQIIILSLSQSNIASIGEQMWTCSHGTDSVNYEATVIAVCNNGSVIYNDDKLELSCSCGHPNVTATVEYLDDSGNSETFTTNLQPKSTQTGNCANDGRAVDFSLPKPEIVSERIAFIKGEICASFKTQSQYSDPERVCVPAGTVTTDYITKATTNSTSSIVNGTACSTKTTSCSTSSPTTTHVMIILLLSVGCGGLIIIITIVIILKRRHLKTPKNNISQTQQKPGLENAACSNL